MSFYIQYRFLLSMYIYQCLIGKQAYFKYTIIVSIDTLLKIEDQNVPFIVVLFRALSNGCGH